MMSDLQFHVLAVAMVALGLAALVCIILGFISVYMTYLCVGFYDTREQAEEDMRHLEQKEGQR